MCDDLTTSGVAGINVFTKIHNIEVFFFGSKETQYPNRIILHVEYFYLWQKFAEFLVDS
jgi:hypothetical protein